MSLRFSLLGLISLVTLSALGCAALVHPGPGWVSVVVTLTAACFAVQTLRAMFARPDARPAAAGWLLFVSAYLAAALGPWAKDQIGPQLVTTRALVYAQVQWRKEDPNPPSQQQAIVDLNLWGQAITTNTALINVNRTNVNAGWAMPVVVGPQSQSLNYFLLAGHWLWAWIAGGIGAGLASHFHRRRAAHSTGGKGSMPATGAGVASSSLPHEV